MSLRSDVLLAALLLACTTTGCSLAPVNPGNQGGLGAPAAPAAPGATPTTPLAGPVSGSLPASPDASEAPEGSGDLESWPGGRLSPARFFQLLLPAALACQRRTGVPAAVTLAQAALETGYGSSTIHDSKNLFGIKGSGPAGSVRALTHEVVGKRRVAVMANFRKYDTWEQSLDDHASLLAGAPQYARAMGVSNDPEAFARELERAHYATGARYAESLIKIMRDNDLIGRGNA